MENETKIKSLVKMGLPLTKKERAIYILLIATDEEARAYIEAEKRGAV